QRRRHHRRCADGRAASGGRHHQSRAAGLVTRRLLILHTGGTLMMKGEDVLTPDVYGRDLVAELPILARIAEIETRILFDRDSGDIQPEHWVTLAKEVHGALEAGRHDGIVVVHGTDTMAYTASAVSIMLGAVPRPVVFTGSQRPLSDVRTDARQNLIDAA